MSKTYNAAKQQAYRERLKVRPSEPQLEPEPEDDVRDLFIAHLRLENTRLWALLERYQVTQGNAAGNAFGNAGNALPTVTADHVAEGGLGGGLSRDLLSNSQDLSDHAEEIQDCYGARESVTEALPGNGGTAEGNALPVTGNATGNVTESVTFRATGLMSRSGLRPPGGFGHVEPELVTAPSAPSSGARAAGGILKKIGEAR